MSALTAKQRRFAELVASGKDNATAYREAYGSKSDPKVTKVKGYTLRHHEKVAEYIAELMAKNEEAAQRSRADILRLLEEVMDNSEGLPRDRLKAAEVYIKVCGYDAPTQVNVNGQQAITLSWKGE